MDNSQNHLEKEIETKHINNIPKLSITQEEGNRKGTDPNGGRKGSSSDENVETNYRKETAQEEIQK